MAITIQEATELLTLVDALAPTAVGLVKALATKLQGKTDEELKATGDAIDDQGIADAQAEIEKLQPPATPPTQS